MNLVQINERLKDLPMQVVQQYANGMNPEVPPYLALGELQRREIAQKQMATAQGGMQGPQPSIKEQVEQKAGLLALQQMQQQQVAQQMQQPRGPMPAPAGVPQPEPQPEAMARGGLAAIPVRRDMFEYAGGGIIAFQSGGDVAEKYRKEAEEMGEGKRIQFSPDVQAYAKQIRSSEVSDQQAYAQRERQQMLERSREVAPDREALMSGPNVTQETMRRVGPMTAPKFADPRIPQARPEEAVGLPAALQKPPAAPPAAGPRAAPAGAPAGLPAAATAKPQGAPDTLLTTSPSNVTPYMKKLEDMIAKEPVAPTEEGIMASINKLSPAAMQEAAIQKRIEDQRARAEQERSAYEKSRPSGLDELIRVFGQAGQYKGLSGLAPAYTAMQQQRRAEDLAMEKRQNELLTAIEGREYEGAKELFGTRTKAFDTAKQLFGREKESAIKAAGELAQVDQNRINNELKLISEEKLKKLELASRAADRAQQGAGLALKTDYLAKMAKSRQLAEAGDTAGAAKLAAEAADILTVSGAGPAGDRNPTPTDRLRAAQSILNDIDSTAEEKTMAKKEISSIMSGGGAGKQNPSARPITEAEYKKLPKGATYIAPDGSQRTKG